MENDLSENQWENLLRGIVVGTYIKFSMIPTRIATENFERKYPGNFLQAPT